MEIIKRKAIPTIIKNLKNEEINLLLETLKKRPVLTHFAELGEQTIAKKIQYEKPSGNENIDYYNWGYRRGLLDTHVLYKNLVNLLEEEKRERENKKIK